MPHIDLYSIYQLDRRQSPEAMAAALTEQFNRTDPRDALSRSRIETARTVLADPDRRARYDAQLADPNAPTIDEVALATIAGRPVPTAPRTGLAGAFAETKAKILAGVVCLLALILVISVTAVACSGDSSTSSTASDGAKPSSEQTSGDEPTCWVEDNGKIERAKWTSGRTDDGTRQPMRVIVLTQEINLPAEFAGLATGDLGYGGSLVLNDLPYRGLTQFQDKTIGVIWDNRDGGSQLLTGGSAALAIVSPEGKVLSSTTYTADNKDQAPRAFDLAKGMTQSAYYRVEATNGVQIPASAKGTETNQNHVSTILPDAFDEKALWVLMRGSAKLYKAKLYASSKWTAFGTSADISNCRN